MAHVVLVGMMGSGKTATGQELARLLGRRFVDCDDEVVAAAGRSIPEIFAVEGEAGFRRHETRTLAAVLAGPSAVIAAGGGVVIKPENRRLLRAATVCWLRARPEVLVARVGSDPNRPLLADSGGDHEARRRLEKLLAERGDWYEEVADILLNVDDLSVAEAAAALFEQVEAGARATRST